MKKIILIIGIVILVLVIVAGVFVTTFNPNDYRATIQTKLEQQLNRRVQLGDMSLGLFPLRFRVSNLAIAEDPQFASSLPFVKTQELSVSVKLLPLLSKSVQVDSLTLKRPSVELIKNAQGTWNFATVGQSSKASEPTPAQGQQQFSLGELAVEDGQVAITDLQAHKPRTLYDHVNIKLTDFAPKKPFDLNASVQLPGAGTQEVRLQGRGGPLAHDNPAATPFQGALDLKAVRIGDLQKFLQVPALADTDGVLTGHTNIASQKGQLSANGQLNFDQPRLHGIDVGYPINADFDVNDDLTNDLLNINRGAIKLGPTPLLISGSVNSKTPPSQLNLNLQANNVSIEQIARLAAAAGVAFSPNTTVNGQVTANIHAKGPADKPTLNGTLGGRDIQISGKDIVKPVLVKAVNITLTPDEIRSDNFNATSGATTVATQFTMKQYTSRSPLVDATLRAPQAALPELLSMAKAYGVTGLEKISGAGNLSLDMHATGPLQALTSEQVVKALNGNMNVNFNNVRYAGVDISHRLTSLVGSGQADQGFTNVLKMTGNILVKNGVAQSNDLQAVLDIGSIGASGTADLASQALNMQVTAVLTKALSQQIGGASVGGKNIGSYMNAALSNNNGELVIPAIVTGTLQSPKFTPDTKKIGQMKLKGLMPTADNPMGGAASLLGQFTGKKQQQPAPGQQQTQPAEQNSVDQILGLFKKKKK